VEGSGQAPRPSPPAMCDCTRPARTRVAHAGSWPSRHADTPLRAPRLTPTLLLSLHQTCLTSWGFCCRTSTDKCRPRAAAKPLELWNSGGAGRGTRTDTSRSQTRLAHMSRRAALVVLEGARLHAPATGRHGLTRPRPRGGSHGKHSPRTQHSPPTYSPLASRSAALIARQKALPEGPPGPRGRPVPDADASPAGQTGQRRTGRGFGT
jgi:hypothetical protein